MYNTPVGELEGQVRGGVACHDDGGPPVSVGLGGVDPAGHHLFSRDVQLRQPSQVLPDVQTLNLMTLQGTQWPSQPF